MSIPFCLKCLKAYQPLRKLKYADTVICPTCKEDLKIIDQEVVTLSNPKVGQLVENSETDEDRLNTGIFRPLKVDLGELECEEALKHNPKDTDALMYLGKRYKSRGELEKSLGLFIKITKINPKSFEPREHLADIYLAKKEFKSALFEMNVILPQTDQKDFILYNFGMAYLQDNQIKKALKCFKNVMKITKEEGLKGRVEELISYLDHIK
jgi:tetratricopeptide (TPR) repeat protein